ncbi:Transcriptional regulator, TetR family protein [Minicystis rosea]|nr:Transcriptional regulator, TetR family protein [Minicystis rosea]
MPQLTKARVLEEAVALLDDVGLDALTMRKLAERLGVQAGAIYWHYENKQALLGAMAEQMLAGCVVEGTPDPARWAEQTTAQMIALRRALLAHRDGGRVFAGTFVAAPNTLGLADAIVGTLRAVGLPPKDAAWTAMSMIHFVIGFVVEEQAAAGLDVRTFLSSLSDARFAHVSATAAHFTSTDYEARFAYGLDLMLGGTQRTIDRLTPAATKAGTSRARRPKRG